jgi:hypothetical protein
MIASEFNKKFDDGETIIADLDVAVYGALAKKPGASTWISPHAW